MDILINAKTGTETTDSFTVTALNPCTLVAHGLAGTEAIEVQASYDGANFTDIYDYADSSQVVLTATGNIRSISTPGIYRLVKPETDSAVTVGRYAGSF